MATGQIVIPDPHLPTRERLVQFSFKHLDDTNPKFLPQDCPLDYWRQLAQRLKQYSHLPLDVFLNQNNPDRRHFVDFKDTTEPNGFTTIDTEQLGYEEPWQFELGSWAGWRVVGLLVDEMFYVIWLDHSHRLYY